MKLKSLGLEIRKIGNIKDLYNDVDMTLNRFDVESKSINTSVQVQTVAHSLQKMLKVGRHFNVCDIRACSELCQVSISSERMNVYRAIHCMDWAEMTDDYRRLIVAMVLDDFREVLNFNNDGTN